MSRLGDTLFFETPVHVQTWAAAVGTKEGQGPLGKCFDHVTRDNRFGKKTWEQAESRMVELACEAALSKADLTLSRIDCALGGDLLNQCISTGFAARGLGLPYLGLYGACSTMAQSLLTCAMMVDGGYAKQAVAMTSSHFASSERQYRFPLGYGGQRTPTAQWTVTGAGAALIGATGEGPVIESCTIGTVTDLGIKDANNMGAAMAPAALSTIMAHMEDLSVAPGDFDRIITGDLGKLGKEALLALASAEGLELEEKLDDCGTMVFDLQTQDVNSGGSGCGCSAITLCGHLLEQIKTKKWSRILFCGTGALLSPTSTQQGLPVPGICHAVSITAGGDR